MKFEEMRKWTERFNQIIGGSQGLKGKRLNTLLVDFIQAHKDKNFDPIAGLMFAAIIEEMGG